MPYYHAFVHFSSRLLNAASPSSNEKGSWLALNIRPFDCEAKTLPHHHSYLKIKIAHSSSMACMYYAQIGFAEVYYFRPKERSPPYFLGGRLFNWSPKVDQVVKAAYKGVFLFLFLIKQRDVLKGWTAHRLVKKIYIRSPVVNII